MDAIRECAAALEQAARPKDLIETEIFSAEAKPLKLLTETTDESQVLLARGNALNRPRKNFIKKKQGGWTGDFTNPAPGFFDDAGNFTVGKQSTVSYTWFIKRDGKVDGPFSEQEMKKFGEAGSLRNTLVKRDFDRGFVDTNKLMEEIPNFYYCRTLNKYFAVNQIMEEVQSNEDSFYVRSQGVSSVNSRLDNFCSTHNISASYSFMIGKINGKRKEEAIGILRGVTGLEKVETERLIELLVEHAGKQVLKDVDEEGYTIATSTSKGKKKGWQKSF